jgi:DNA-directed RNA polymerase specialized sigma subunit
LPPSNAPCGRCGWKFPGFHCCIDRSDPTVRQVVTKPRDLKARNKRIIHLYTQDIKTVREIAEELQLTTRVVLDVLHKARDKGSLTMRPRGVRRDISVG